MSDDRVCSVCGGSLVGRRADAKTCQGMCRTRAWRERRAQRQANESPTPSVTVTGQPVTLAGLLGGPCPDPSRCLHWQRYASGPWTCSHNHPRIESSEAA